jgi:methionyl aminopeptidase
MALAIEPMVNVGTDDVKVLKDNWTVITVDLKRSAHYENTIIITDDEPEILTLYK